MHTIKEMRRLFEVSLWRTCTRNSLVRYCYALDHFFDKFQEKKHVEDIHRSDVLEWREWRLRDGAAPSTVNYDTRVVRSFYNWMKDRELVTYNPATKMQKLREPENPPRALSVETVHKLLAVCETDSQRMQVLFPLTTGCRVGEIIQLRWKDIDFERKVLLVPAEITKTKSGRTLPLNVQVLQSLLGRRVLLEAKGKYSPEDLLFPGNDDTFRNHLYRLANKAGVRLSGAHAFRHTYATWLSRSGVDIVTVKSLMGHKSISTTMRYLTPADSESVRGVLDGLPLS